MTATLGSPAKPARQEQEPATDEVTEVAPGVLRIQLPISMPGLGHVNCYALEDERGFALVDPGLPGPDSWAALDRKLDHAGVPVRRVHSIVVTHSHPDHYGGAQHLRREAGAEIVGHDLFRSWWGSDEEYDPDAEHPPGVNPETGTPITLGGGTAPWGSHFDPPPVNPRAGATREQIRSWYATPTPTLRLADGDPIRLAGREWLAVHTPGHTPDHLCLFDPAEGTVLSGDHVLPTITPHISGIGAGIDPLAGFFASLERMHQLEGVSVVLPAHGHPFHDLDGRVDAIRHHHEQRLATLAEASARLGPATVADLSHELFAERSWGPMAESETYAHLEHLRLGGRATRSEQGGVLFYAIP